MGLQVRQKRKPKSEITANTEDAGLFQGELSRLEFELIPQMRRNDRGDLLIRSFINKHLEVEVVFAGRRAEEVAPLEKKLRHMMSRARATRSRLTDQDIEAIRLPVKIEGTWTPVFHRDIQGQETRTYQFFAARWSFEGHDGFETSGEPARNPSRNTMRSTGRVRLSRLRPH